MNQRIDALAGQRADFEDARSFLHAVRELVAARCGDGVLAHLLLETANVVLHPGNVAFVRDHDAGAAGKFVGIKGQLTIDDAVILDRIATLVAARHVHDMENEGRALDMAKELMTQAATLMGAFDQARGRPPRRSCIRRL